MLEQYDDLITISELREILNIGRNAAYDLLNQGAIPAFRIGRNWKIPKDAVIFYLSQ
ncbi:MAG: helix-turn-helix domain-containing protein [Oscillibacter sp.]|nr:helix-turn-helix domain-containing protein [Oscillibacter sp.]